MRYLEVDNFLEEQQKKAVWYELEAFSNKEYLVNSNKDDWTTTTDESTGEKLASSFRMFPNIVYSDVGFDVSPICRVRYKLHETVKEVAKGIPDFRNFSSCESWSTIAHYYEDGGYYKPHTDRAMFTALLWLAKDQSKFEGGDIKFADLNETSKFADNKLLVFPSFLLHESTAIKFKQPETKGFGKVTLSYFFTTHFNK